MPSVIAQGLVTSVALVVLWKVLKWFAVESPLECIPGPPSASWITGNAKQLFDDYGWDFYYEMLDQYGSVTKLKGLFGENMLFTLDPKAMHHVLVKDQDFYEEAPSFVATTKIILGDGLMGVLGEQHRKQRKMLNPVFSISHMREMTSIFYEVTNRLRQALVHQVQSGPKEVDMLHWMSRTALELIGQSGMAYSFDSLKDDTTSADFHPYHRSVRRLGGLFVGAHIFLISNYIFPLAIRFNYPRLKRWVVDHIPWKRAQDIKNIVDVMEDTAKDICETKKRAIESGESDGMEKDIISILMRANASASEGDKLTDGEMVAQVATLVAAGMDTTSSALSRILSLLATHPHVQDKIRAELLEAKQNNSEHDLEYDQLVSLRYLDAVCRETLRLYPPLATASRVSRKDMVLPLSKPLRTTSGTDVTELMVPNGTNVFISILGANTNPEVWGIDSYEWKPERWLQPLPEKVGEAHVPGIYSNLMTFLGGGRACIGFKFSQLEMKVVLSTLMTTFKFEDSGKKILWKMPGVAAPVVEGRDVTRPALPLIVSLLEKE